jgi:PAS domain S-box-containing protein
MDLRPHKRSLIAIGVALAFPALIILFIQFAELRQEKAKIETEALARAKQITLLADLQIQSDMNALKMLASRNSIVSQSWSEARTSFKQAAALNPTWKNILIIDIRNNKLKLALHETEMPKLPGNISEITVASPIVDGITLKGTNCPCTYVYVAIPALDGKSRNVLAVGMDPGEIQRILLEHLPENTISAVVDSEGNFIARWPNYEERVGTPATQNLRNAIKNAKSGIFRGVTYEGFRSYTAFFTSPETGWSTHVAMPRSEIDSPRTWSFIIASFGTIAAFGIAGFLIIYIIKQFESSTSGQLSAIVESSDDAIVSKNLDGIIMSWNKSAERIFGYIPQEAVGQHISIIIPPDRMAEETEIIRRIKAGERLSHFETVRRKKDGSIVNLSITVSPVKDKHGRIIGASKVARDITERKETELQLQEERDTLETLNRLAPRLATTIDLQTLIQLATDEATKVTGAAYGAFFYNVTNEEGTSYLLYTLSGAPRESFANFAMPRATAIFSPTFKGESTILSDDVTADTRYGLNKPHAGMPKGHLPVKSYLAVPVVLRTGEVIGGLFFGHPDTGIFKERDARIAEGIAGLAAVGIDNARLYEQVKLGQKKAEDANRAKTDFLATMSHEIRTPMNAIIGLSSILSMSEPLTPKQREFIKTLRSSSDSLLSLINDLLDISKIEAHTVDFEDVPLSLTQLVKEVEDMMSVRAQEKGLAFTVDHHQVNNKSFMGDPGRLRQILTNLCGNAIKFTESGSVSLKITERDEPHNICVCVTDTGIGIAEENLDTIFEKFVQADSSINRLYGGTGLGLSITKRLVDLMNGTIHVKSQIGKGSSFTVCLPLRSVDSKLVNFGAYTPAFSAKKKRDSQQKKVLLVEDHEPNILVAGTFLEDLDYYYDVARNGNEAIEKVKSNSYDAVLMDVQMPGMNGFEATHLIRTFEKKENKRHTPIIGITAHAMTGDRERCLSEGMDDYMSKPFNLAELKERLDKLIQSNASASYKAFPS